MESISMHGSPANRFSRSSSPPCFYSDARMGRICIGNQPIFSSSYTTTTTTPSPSLSSSSSDECLSENMIPMQLPARHKNPQSLPFHVASSYTPRSRSQIKPKLWFLCSSIDQTSVKSPKPAQTRRRRRRRGKRRGISSILFHNFFASISCKDISIAAGSDDTTSSSSKVALSAYQSPAKDSPLKALTAKNGEKKMDLSRLHENGEKKVNLRRLHENGEKKMDLSRLHENGEKKVDFSRLQNMYGEGEKHLKVEEASSRSIFPYVGRIRKDYIMDGKKKSVDKDKKVVDSCLLSSKFDLKEVTVIPDRIIRVLMDPQEESRNGNKASFKDECILDSADRVSESSLESDEELVEELGISCKEGPSPQDVSTCRYFQNIDYARDNHQNQKSKQCVKIGCTGRSRIFIKSQPEAEKCSGEGIQALAAGDMPNLCMGLNSMMEKQTSSFPPNVNVGLEKLQMREDDTDIISASTSIINSTEQQSPVSILDADFEHVSKTLVEDESSDDNPSLRSLASFQDKSKRKLMERFELYEQLKSMYFSMFEMYMHCRCSSKVISPTLKSHNNVDGPLSQYIWEKPHIQVDVAWDVHHLSHPYLIKENPGSANKWTDFTTEMGEIVEELERSLVATLLHDELRCMLLHSSL